MKGLLLQIATQLFALLKPQIVAEIRSVLPELTAEVKAELPELTAAATAEIKKHMPELTDAATAAIKAEMPGIMHAVIVAITTTLMHTAVTGVDHITDAIPGPVDDAIIDPIMQQIQARLGGLLG